VLANIGREPSVARLSRQATFCTEAAFAKNRADLEAATRALDRILLWNHYVVPQWYYNKVRTARWDRFGHPDLMPKYGTAAFPTVWWLDVQKAAKAG
jgi:microcin C transport system substrate-binding protein